MVVLFFFLFTAAENSWQTAFLIGIDMKSPFQLPFDWASTILAILGYLFVPAFIGAVVSFYVTNSVRHLTEEELQEKIRAILADPPSHPPNESKSVRS